jgi:hypothetical protein
MLAGGASLAFVVRALCRQAAARRCGGEDRAGQQGVVGGDGSNGSSGSGALAGVGRAVLMPEQVDSSLAGQARFPTDSAVITVRARLGSSAPFVTA